MKQINFKIIVPKGMEKESMENTREVMLYHYQTVIEWVEIAKAHSILIHGLFKENDDLESANKFLQDYKEYEKGIAQIQEEIKKVYIMTFGD